MQLVNQIPVSNRISHVDHVKIGEILCKIVDNDTDITILGRVVDITTNSRGRKCLVLDRCCKLSRSHDWTHHLTQRAFSAFRIRKYKGL